MQSALLIDDAPTWRISSYESGVDPTATFPAGVRFVNFLFDQNVAAGAG